MHFGENHLSPSLLGLSPLTTGHPPCFQPWWVRPSTGSYPRFSLPMARSLGLEENHVSPSLLGLSPLTTGQPPCFQPWWVRPSTGSYPRFSLPMARSLGFGSTARD